ncbi:MAG: bifunctional DNA-formamidopyrimidine glycosylase/DNA-(apurinic or apyrimidinic site) lyase [Acidobacteriia bacterium]|nr:bifunctional DNA-formamidopyrimidine glycosylase/DNA-(apurinic or apyrimidinic site) lyase [Terriglobia bacterium]
MPELPEVETIACKLRSTIAGKRIAAVHLSGKALRRPIPADLASILQGRAIRSIHRRGKYLILEMEPHAFWLIHLGMSGRIFYLPSASEPPKHTHATFRFTDGGELQFCDPRRFGLMDVYQVSSLAALPELRLLGKDPLSSGFNADWLLPELAQSRREIKSFLLDQHKIAGLGNIYVCEAMFRARVHPTRRCDTFTRREAVSLARAIREVLRAAIRNRGTSFSDFMDSDGEPGAHQDFLHVFQREGEKCRRCRATIVRMRQGNRSTYYCPRCQNGRLGSQGKKG